MAAREYQEEISKVDITLKSIEQVLNLPKLIESAIELERQASEQNLWDDPQAAQVITSKLSRAQSTINKISSIRTRLDDLPVQDKIAVVFGNEHDGIAKEWLEHVDFPFTIPMVGHVESLNISVSAAVTLHSLTMRARNILPESQYLISEIEQKKILNEWVCNQFRSWPVLIERVRQKNH